MCLIGESISRILSGKIDSKNRQILHRIEKEYVMTENLKI